jgi:hypothetical protein
MYIVGGLNSEMIKLFDADELGDNEPVPDELEELFSMNSYRVRVKKY